ncbi:hypothetical protein OAF54_01015 [bacterium]|nr:hypothetical protein [bacterium]
MTYDPTEFHMVLVDDACVAFEEANGYEPTPLEESIMGDIAFDMMDGDSTGEGVFHEYERRMEKSKIESMAIRHEQSMYNKEKMR